MTTPKAKSIATPNVSTLASQAGVTPPTKTSSRTRKTPVAKAQPKPAPVQRSVRKDKITRDTGSFYEKSTPVDVALARAKFMSNNVKHMYTQSSSETVKNWVKILKKEDMFAGVQTDAILEEMVADCLKKSYRHSERAEMIGLTNAMGYDIIDSEKFMFIEVKDYSANCRGGAKSPRISAMVSNLANKFCSILVLVTDCSLNREEKYQLYLIPATAIYTDESDVIEIKHQRLHRGDIADVLELNKPLGGAFAQYKVASLGDLHNHQEVLQQVNMKKLAKVLVDLTNSPAITTSQEIELGILTKAFTHFVNSHNRAIKSKGPKYPVDFNDPVYKITKDPKVPRLFWNGTTIITQENAQVTAPTGDEDE